TVEDLARTRGLGRRLAEGPGGAELLAAVAEGLGIPDSELPMVERSEALPRGIVPINDILKVLLKMKSEQHQVASKLIANSDDIDSIAAYGDKSDVAALHGWRRTVFGADAVQLRAGKRAMVVNGQTL